MAKTNALPKDLLKFLDAADEDFIYAYETRKYGVLSDRFTHNAMRIISMMVSIDGGTRYFGKRNMRNTTWEVIDDDYDQMRVQKTCVYKNIHVTLFKTIKASEDYTCEWVLKKDLENDNWKVDSISQEELLYGY